MRILYLYCCPLRAVVVGLGLWQKSHIHITLSLWNARNLFLLLATIIIVWMLNTRVNMRCERARGEMFLWQSAPASFEGPRSIFLIQRDIHTLWAQYATILLPTNTFSNDHNRFKRRPPSARAKRGQQHNCSIFFSPFPFSPFFYYIECTTRSEAAQFVP